ncbi:VOC family protein [Nocardioides speluncae]|uniref:VOC family protein n=1 Tax=Nocardioides speluncae TaxID=2670337 RepID=UPI000D69EAEA|nr:VOC family protein [Nocardioides speluncae]
MTSFISHTTVNAVDAYKQSEWWKQVLGYEDMPGDPNLPGHEECMIRKPDGSHHLLFIDVDNAKPDGVRNRIHFDLRPAEGSRDEELERLLGLGASVVDDLRGKYGPGTGWVVLADPEGNEFCILRSEAELETS